MRSLLVFCLLSLLGGSSLPGSRSVAQSWDDREVTGSLVTVSVDVDGARAPLYPAADDSGRWYLEARVGAEYAVTVANRTPERLGVVLAVDGLNAVSGERQRTFSFWRRSDPGRMYVLDPWDRTTVRGWRRSLEEVRRFTFVDERASYAARSGKANAKMGWIEIVVFRERNGYAHEPRLRQGRIAPSGEHGAGEAAERGAEPAREPSPPAAAAPKDLGALRDKPSGNRPSHPGTGWGPRAVDPVILVDFEPEKRPAERITLRYEYADALVALGILPRSWHDTDRLAERERGGEGFAQPPRR